MQKIDYQIETVQIAIYNNIVQNLIKNHKELSLCKVVVFSYLIKQSKSRVGELYNANTQNNRIYKAISTMSGDYDKFINSIDNIIKAIHLLIQNRTLNISNSKITIADNATLDKPIYKETTFIASTIEDSKNISDRQFIKEVMSIV